MSEQKKRIGAALATICFATWIVTAVHPLDRQAWILENLLVGAFVVVLLFFHGRLELSTVSYFCIATFLILHLIGAHYTYAQMPVGAWAKQAFHLSRNHYDRFAHGSFGFLLAFPVRELLLRFTGTRRTWAYWLAPAVILAVSGLFEIIESVTAEIVAPGQGVNWLAGQGDEWDAQNDMLCALIGSFLMMGAVRLIECEPKPK